MSLKQRLTDDMKAAMRSGDKARLGVIRLINAAIKQREVDERTEMDDGQVLAILEKMRKQRRDSVDQYESAKREDLAAVERAEIAVIEDYLPAPLSETELDALIDTVVTDTGASSLRDMGTVMARIKPQATGRADMAAVSQKVKQRLGGSPSD